MKTRSISAVCASVLMGISSSVLAAPVAIPISDQGTWETTLQGRDLDGNMATIEAYYDTVLNITWLADADYAQTSGYDADGLLSWADTNTWVANLDINGIGGWRLPSVSPINGMSFNYSFYYIGWTDRGYNISAPGTTYAGSTASEMSHMFYNTLGNAGMYATSGAFAGCNVHCLENPGPFVNLRPDVYWSGTEYDSWSAAWYFWMNFGEQNAYNVSGAMHAWAVHDGDVGVSVSSVPVPAAVWLFSFGLLGLLGATRRKAR